MKGEKVVMPIVPPLSATAFICSSVTQRGFSVIARTAVWEITMGFFDSRTASRVVRMPTCEQSMRMPRRLHSRTTCMPKWVRPRFSGSRHPSPRKLRSM